MLAYNTLLKKVKSKVNVLIGESATLSYPIAEVENGINIDKFFIYSISHNKMRSRPYAVIKVSAQDGTILSYENCHLNDFMNTERYPFSEPISYEVPVKNIDELVILQKELYTFYEDVRKAVFEGKMTDAHNEVIDKYLEKLEQAVPFALIPFYQVLGENLYKLR